MEVCIMARKIWENGASMGNNHEQNKAFDQAAREANLTFEEKCEFRDRLHSDKDFETGDKSYSELLALAQEVKRR